MDVIVSSKKLVPHANHRIPVEKRTKPPEGVSCTNMALLEDVCELEVVPRLMSTDRRAVPACLIGHIN